MPPLFLGGFRRFPHIVRLLFHQLHPALVKAFRQGKLLLRQGVQIVAQEFRFPAAPGTGVAALLMFPQACLLLRGDSVLPQLFQESRVLFTIHLIALPSLCWTREASKGSAPDEQILLIFSRARFTRLFTVPVATPSRAAASS